MGVSVCTDWKKEEVFCVCVWWDCFSSTNEFLDG